MYGALIYMIAGAPYQIIVAACLSNLVDLTGITPRNAFSLSTVCHFYRSKFTFLVRIISFLYVNIVLAKNM